jgi:hypothetical protein
MDVDLAWWVEQAWCCRWWLWQPPSYGTCCRAVALWPLTLTPGGMT